jgi:stage III sporulation protein AD
MSGWIRSLAYVAITLFLGAVLKELGFKGSRLVTLLCTVSLLGAAVLCFGELREILPFVRDTDKEYAVVMLKMVGIGYAFGICSDVCREMGENMLAGAVSLFGRVEILILALPYIKRIVETGTELI